MPWFTQYEVGCSKVADPIDMYYGCSIQSGQYHYCLIFSCVLGKILLLTSLQYYTRYYEHKNNTNFLSYTAMYYLPL